MQTNPKYAAGLMDGLPKMLSSEGLVRVQLSNLPVAGLACVRTDASLRSRSALNHQCGSLGARLLMAALPVCSRAEKWLLVLTDRLCVARRARCTPASARCGRARSRTRSSSSSPSSASPRCGLTLVVIRAILCCHEAMCVLGCGLLVPFAASTGCCVRRAAFRVCSLLTALLRAASLLPRRVQAIYKRLPKKKEDMTKVEQMGVIFSAGYLAGTIQPLHWRPLLFSFAFPRRFVCTCGVRAPGGLLPAS